MVIDANSSMPLSEMGKDGLMHYPQLIYTFDTPITDEQLADISVALESNGLDAFNINNNEVKVSVIKTFTEDEQQNLDENEQRESREQDYNSKTVATAKSIYDVLGSNAKGSLNIRVKKSSYQGAINEGTADQTRQYNRSDVFKEFKESSTKIEKLGAELSKLRQKQIELQKVDIQDYDGLYEYTENSSRDNIIKSFLIPPVLLVRTSGSLGTSKEISDATEFYNAITADDRLIIEEILKQVFSNFSYNICPSKDYSILPLKVEKELDVAYSQYFTKNEFRQSLGYEALEDAKSDNSVLAVTLGVGGTQALTSIIVPSLSTNSMVKSNNLLKGKCCN